MLLCVFILHILFREINETFNTQYQRNFHFNCIDIFNTPDDREESIEPNQFTAWLVFPWLQIVTVSMFLDAHFRP